MCRLGSTHGRALQPSCGMAHVGACIAFQYSVRLPHHYTLHLWGSKLNDQFSAPLVWQQIKMTFPIGEGITKLFQRQFPPPKPELVDSLPAHCHDSYTRDFHIVDDAFYSG